MSIVSARPAARAVTEGENASEAAAARTTPCTAAVTLRERRGGSAARSHGSAHPAATNAYRIAPITTTHAPARPATCTLSSRMR